MSALAKSVLAFSERFTVHHNGRVWVPEELWANWLEFARREVKGEQGRVPHPVPMPSGGGSR